MAIFYPMAVAAAAEATVSIERIEVKLTFIYILLKELI
jgi:hypothetical protein